MNDVRFTKYLYAALVIISCTMFIWTANYICASNTMEIPTAITAFNA